MSKPSIQCKEHRTFIVDNCVECLRGYIMSQRDQIKTLKETLSPEMSTLQWLSKLENKNNHMFEERLERAEGVVKAVQLFICATGTDYKVLEGFPEAVDLRVAVEEWEKVTAAIAKDLRKRP